MKNAYDIIISNWLPYINLTESNIKTSNFKIYRFTKKWHKFVPSFFRGVFNIPCTIYTNVSLINIGDMKINNTTIEVPITLKYNASIDKIDFNFKEIQ